MISVNYDNILFNARKIKETIGDKCKLCAVVKADAYGHGMSKTVDVLQDTADMFAVDRADDALSILPLPVMMLVPVEFGDAVRLIDCGAILTVDSFDTLKCVKEASKISGKRAHVHIKLDTGMARLGFCTDEISRLFDALKDCRSVTAEGVYSHFCSADNDKEYSEKQFEIFVKNAKLFKELNSDIILHIANTAGICCDSRFCLDMARVGIGLYGYGMEGLKPAKSCTARVLAVRRVQSGNRVGYGNTVCDGDKKLATVKIGYANGYPRIMKSVGGGWFNGKFLPIVGNVCMGMMMLDCTDCEIGIGEEVVILSDEHVLLHPEQIIYEMLCNLRE